MEFTNGIMLVKECSWDMKISFLIEERNMAPIQYKKGNLVMPTNVSILQ